MDLKTMTQEEQVQLGMDTAMAIYEMGRMAQERGESLDSCPWNDNEAIGESFPATPTRFWIKGWMAGNDDATVKMPMEADTKGSVVETASKDLPGTLTIKIGPDGSPGTSFISVDGQTVGMVQSFHLAVTSTELVKGSVIFYRHEEMGKAVENTLKKVPWLLVEARVSDPVTGELISEAELARRGTDRDLQEAFKRNSAEDERKQAAERAQSMMSQLAGFAQKKTAAAPPPSASQIDEFKKMMSKRDSQGKNTLMNNPTFSQYLADQMKGAIQIRALSGVIDTGAGKIKV